MPLIKETTTTAAAAAAAATSSAAAKAAAGTSRTLSTFSAAERRATKQHAKHKRNTNNNNNNNSHTNNYNNNKTKCKRSSKSVPVTPMQNKPTTSTSTTTTTNFMPSTTNNTTTYDYQMRRHFDDAIDHDPYDDDDDDDEDDVDVDGKIHGIVDFVPHSYPNLEPNEYSDDNLFKDLEPDEDSSSLAMITPPPPYDTPFHGHNAASGANAANSRKFLFHNREIFNMSATNPATPSGGSFAHAITPTKISAAAAAMFAGPQMAQLNRKWTNLHRKRRRRNSSTGDSKELDKLVLQSVDWDENEMY